MSLKNYFQRSWPTPLIGGRGGPHLECNFDGVWRDLIGFTPCNEYFELDPKNPYFGDFEFEPKNSNIDFPPVLKK